MNNKNKRRNFPRGEGSAFYKSFFFFFFSQFFAKILTMHMLIFPFPSHTNLLLFYFHYFTLLHQKC